MRVVKAVLVCALFIGAAMLVGCETAKGVAQGVGTTLEGTVTGAAKDTKGLFGAIMSLDEWIKKNLW